MIVSVSLSPSDPVQIEQHNRGYHESVEMAWEKTQDQYALRSLQTVSRYAQDNNLETFEVAMEDLLIDGEYNGTSQEVSLEAWSQGAKDISNSLNYVEISSSRFNVSNMTLSASSRAVVDTVDRHTEYRASGDIQIEAVEDPLITQQLGNTITIEPCSYDNLASRAVDDGSTNGTARGFPLIEPSDPASELNPESHVLLAEDITDFENSTVDDFAGYVSVQEPDSPSDYNSNYLVGISELPDFDSGQTAIIFQGLWKGNFDKTVQNECYLPSSLENTPGVVERLNKDSTGSDNQGVYTVLNISESDQTADESNIGYERINSSGRELVMIEGVSRGEGIVWPYFRMSRELANEAGIEGLTE